MIRDESDSDIQSEAVVDESVDSETRSTESTGSYTSGALISNQPRMIDFVPQKAMVVAGIFFMLVAIVALLNIAHFRLLPVANRLGIDASTLDMTLDRSLLSWISSFLLLSAAFFCLQVYQIRKFSADDYVGSYRVWIWLALGFVIASIDATARISPILSALIAANWEAGVLANEHNVWLMMVGLPASFFCYRLMRELWRSRVAIGSIAVASLAYLFANSIRLEMLPIEMSNESIVQANSTALAHCSIFFMAMWYARFVLLESQHAVNVLPVPESIQSTTQSKATSKPKSTKQTKATSQTATSKSKKAAEEKSVEGEEEIEEEVAKPRLMGEAIHKMRKKGKQNKQQRRRAA